MHQAQKFAGFLVFVLARQALFCFHWVYSFLKPQILTFFQWHSSIYEQLGSHESDFLENRYLNIFVKPDEKSKVSLKPDKNNGY